MAADMHRLPQPHAGLTLIEILITLTLGLLILGAAYSLTTSTADANALLTARTQLRADAMVGTQLLSARLREACSVMTAGTSVTLPAVPGTKNAAGTRVWKVGTNFMGLVVPARVTEVGSTPVLYAYYLMDRTTYNDQMSAQQKIAATGAASLVLMEFQVPLPSTPDPCAVPALGALSIPSGGARALMLAENVRPPTAAEVALTAESDLALTYRLRFEKTIGGKATVYPPLADTPLQASIVGRNVR
ncbi:prepilin-type N-terminal cleavage/methylation domain-containing protein [Deinococcus sp. JMULE3]|nr:prepilin-type N-terminal cleavage/methylation domain-containing protein [Deinococcus sp. JMULE3]